MAFWNPGGITGINDGIVADDGTGDPIRNAFVKVNENFSNISAFLSQPTLDFLYSNVTKLTTEYITTENVFWSNALGHSTTLTGNITADNIIANTGLHVTGITTLTGNTIAENVTFTGTPYFAGGNVKVAAHLIPTANLQYDLGSPDAFYRNIYAKGLVQVNTVSLNADASILQLQPNVTPGTFRDVGILGQYNKNSSNTYAYFGYQYASDNFVYIQTPLNTADGNSIVTSGVYGNVRFGSLFLSNATPSANNVTGALVVAGGIGATGNVNVVGNVIANVHYGNVVGNYANLVAINSSSLSNVVSINANVSANVIFAQGYQVLTTNTPGLTYYTGAPLFTTPLTVTAANPSTSTTTGALIVSHGGAGIFGNVTAGALVGPLYGTVMTAAQPNITSLGTITNLNATAVNTSSLGAGAITVTSSLNFTAGATLTGLTLLNVSGNSIVGNLSASVGVYGSQIVGTNLYGTLMTNSQPNITSLGTLVDLNVSGTINGNLLGTVITAAQPNITSVGNLTSLSASGKITTTGIISTTGTQGITSSVTDNALLTGGYPSPVTGRLIIGNGTGKQFNISRRESNITTDIISFYDNGNVVTAGNVVSGNINVANSVSAANVTATNITATNVNANFTGAGTGLTGNAASLSVGGSAPASKLTGSALSSNVTTSTLTSVGNITSGTWSGNVVNSNYGGSGVDNNGFTLSWNANYTLNQPLSINAAPTFGTTTHYGSVVPGTNGNLQYNLGSTSLWWNNIYGTLVGSAPAGSLSGSTLATGVTSSSLTAVGNITSGTWSGTVVNSNYGGSGVDNNGFTLSWNANYTLNQSLTTTASVQHNSLGIGTAASGTAGEIRATNNITAYYSDDRLKTRLGNIENALDKIDQLTGFYYEANPTAQALGYEKKREVGLSAQDVQRVMPEVTAPAPIDEQYLTIRYERLAALLVEGIKELRAEVNEIKRRLP